MTATVAREARPLSGLAAPLRAIRGWRYAEAGKRDLRFDFLRGFAVFAMVVDHVSGPRSPLYLITGGDRFFVSAAEAFVFLSGLLMGMINGGLIRRGNLDGALTKVLRRAGMLYALTVGLTLLTAALPLALGLSWAPDAGGVSLAEYVVGIFTLHRTAYLVDIMLLYTLLVLAAEPILLLLDRGYTRLVLAASGILWLVWQRWPQQAELWRIEGNTLFQVSAWQILFVSALVIGFHYRRLERYFRAAATPAALVASGAVLAGAVALFTVGLAPLTALTGRDSATVIEWLFAKDDVGAGRLGTFAAFIVFAYALTSLCWRPLVRALGWLLLPLGQNALSAYVIHIFIVGALAGARAAIFGREPALLVTMLFQVVGVLIVWGAIRLRPVLAASLDHLEGGWAGAPAALIVGPDPALQIEQQALSLDLRVAQAEAHRSVELLR